MSILTPRENAVLAAAAAGWSQREAAARLGTSRGAIRSAMGTAIAKLGTTNALQAVAVAVRDRLIDAAGIPGGRPEVAADASEPRQRTVDYTQGTWGHDYTVTQVIDGGDELRACGWGPAGDERLHRGDYLLLRGKTPGSSTRYQVKDVAYFSDPADMWSAVLRFAPRRPLSKSPTNEGN